MKHLLSKIQLIFTFLLLIAICSCSSLTVDSVTKDKRLLSIDELFIKGIVIKSEDTISIEEDISNNILFSLKEKNYKVESYLESPDALKNYRHHGTLKIYINSIGNALERRDSVSIFFIIQDSKTQTETARIRVSCSGCNLADARDQVKILNGIIEKLDFLVKG